ncbi:DNA repair protein RAD50 [Biscogniauxia marginata]|nr:DNA repair protein RAD50 [Biscogniauxia marginata]
MTSLAESTSEMEKRQSGDSHEDANTFSDPPESGDTTAISAAAAWQMDTSDFPGPKALSLIMIGLFLAMFTNNLDATIIATAIPYITDEFHTIADVGWYVSATFLTFASFQSTWGKAYKYFPLKATFLLSIFIFELGSLVCALAPTSTALIIGRAIAGLGAAGVSSGVFIIIAFSAPPHHVPAYMGIAGATYAIAALVGPLLGGAFTSNATWRWCFWINLPIGAVTAIIIVFVYKAPKAATPQSATWRETILQMDLNGTALIMAAVVCFILAFQWGGWIRRVWANSAHVFFVSGGFFVLIYYLPIYFQSVQGVDPLQSGIRSLPVIIGCFFSIAVGFVIVVYSRLWAPLMAVGAALATIGSGLLYTLDISSPSREWIGYQALVGIGTGITMQIPIMANQAAVTPMDISAVSAITLFFQIIGGSFCVTGAQSAFSTVLVSKAAVYTPEIDASSLIYIGATQIRAAFSAEQIPGVIQAYMDGLKVAFAFAIGLLGTSFIFTLVPRWNALRPTVPLTSDNKESG